MEHLPHRTKPYTNPKFEMTQRVEAQGNQNSENNEKWDDGSDHDDVSKIYVRGDSGGIRYIRFDYIKRGVTKYKSFHGYTDVGFTQTFEINHEIDEQLESVEGYYEPQTSVITGLQFKTNLRISQLIGYERISDTSTKFLLAVEGKKIVGFHGSSNDYVKSLGAYFTWITPTRMEAKGGKGGNEWNDGAYFEGVTKIYVRGGYDGIQYIKFDYVKDGQHIYGSAHGGRGKGFTEPFEINLLDNEYLVSVEGYYDEGDSGIIRGIKFKTNVKTSDLMGEDKGSKFSLAANGKKIIGFHGYADQKNLNSLGAFFRPSSPIITKLEYRGATTTSANPWDDGTFDGVRKVYVHYDNEYVCCVKFDYDNRGKVEKREHGTMATQAGEFVVDYPNEFITHVEGTLNTQGIALVTSLTFKTSKGRTSSTFGSETNSKFVLESNGCGIVGFHGRSMHAIYALGAYFRPLPPHPEAEKVEAEGGYGGASWDDGGFDNIRNIYIGHNEIGIAFVKFLYDKNNQVVVGDDHGSKTLLRVDEFELEYPCEYLISVEGSYDLVDECESESILTMLKFTTNMQTTQVFGLETSSDFILQKEGHKIVGFHGKIGKMLHQIGIHVLPITE